jgi:glycosyltransferase involved in cell wall biosynthesis
VIVNYRGGEAAAFLEKQLWLIRPTLAKVASIIVPSGFLEGVFARYGVRTEVVPNVVDLSRFHPLDRRKTGMEIVVTRNLEDVYDIPTALRAFARIRQTVQSAHLTVAGSGPRLEDCRNLCRELRILDHVTFTGRIDNELVAKLYQRADLVLNPSSVDNMPISLLEAMASGVPIVSTNVGGIPYLVTDSVTALLVPPRDPEAMAFAALRLLLDSNEAKRLAAAGLRLAAEFTWQRVRPRLLEVYGRAAGPRLRRQSAN